MKTHKMQLATLVILQHLLSSFKLKSCCIDFVQRCTYFSVINHLGSMGILPVKPASA